MSGIEEDRVIREIPVFLSKALADQLYLIQYILEPMTCASSDNNILQAKIKPNQDKIELRVEIDTTSSRYDKRKGENLAASAAGVNSSLDGDGSDSDVEENQILNEYVMESSAAAPNSTKRRPYVIGLLRDGQVHLSPLKSIVQMRGKLRHLDEADLNSKKGDGTGEGEPTKVTLKFLQREQHMWKRRGYDAMKRKWDDEPWIDLNYSDFDLEEYEKLISGIQENDTPFYIISRKHYAEAILPKHIPISTEDITEKKSLKHKRLPIAELKHQLLPDQLKHLLVNVKVMRFSQVLYYLKNKLKASIDEIGILRSIQTVAVLVQGCWVVKSDLLYPVEHASDANGVSGEQMQKARDLILCRFTKARILQRQEMCTLTHLPMEEVTEILAGLAVAIPRAGWEFKLPYDAEFVTQYQDVTQRQATMWEMKAANRNRSSSLDIKPAISVPPRRRSGSGSASRHVSFSSDTDSGAESSEGRSKRKSRSPKVVHKW